jgi:O-antigen ligase
MHSAVDLTLSRRIIASAAVVAAVWLGWNIAHGEVLVAALTFAIIAPLLCGYFAGIAPDALVAGAVLLGYLVGNRGFAQIHVPGIPLLPGEVALGAGLLFSAWRMARSKTLFVRSDGLNVFLLLWIVVCSLRLPLDFRLHGFVAIRDFAFVYYALFFFLAQTWSAQGRARRYLDACLSVGFGLVAPVAGAFTLWPEIVTRLTVAGVPLIFIKGDVAGAFMAAGVFWFGARYAQRRTWLSVVLATSCAAGVLFANSRASVVALLLGAVWLAVLRERRMVKVLLCVALLGSLLLAVEATVATTSGRTSRVFRLYESLRTITDFSGTRTPATADLGDKPDNNRFRLVWWQAVLDQTLQDGVWLGLGFGQDLADEFLRRYYADNSDEFNVRSPHNILITVFARTGLVGLLCFLAVLGAYWLRAWRTARDRPDTGAGALWLVPGAIFISACFGVVLEGPMGAVVFWTTLGLANSDPPTAVAGAPQHPHDRTDPLLHAGAPADEVASTT